MVARLAIYDRAVCCVFVFVFLVVVEGRLAFTRAKM